MIEAKHSKVSHCIDSFGLTTQWDTAAAQCIVEQAGGKVVDLAGKPLTYWLERAILNPFFVVRLVNLAKYINPSPPYETALHHTRVR
jgi:3'-phosphoadenosine 5'-phosphosulfate (PAPS) 3'-phosphatase